MSSGKYRQQEIRAPRGTTLTAKSWLTEAPLRMLMNNLDPDVAENPHELVVYGGIGRAARNWDCYDAIVDALTELDADETLLVQSGKPVGVFKTHKNAPDRLTSTFCAPSTMWLPSAARLARSRYISGGAIATAQPVTPASSLRRLATSSFTIWRLPFSFQLPITKGCRISILHALSAN
jgi:hypothetical protein